MDVICMGFSTSTALCPVSGHRAKVIRQADALTRPALVDNLLYDKYSKYSALDKETKALIRKEVLQAVEKSAGNYSLSPSKLGMAGLLEIAHHAIPVGISAAACGFTALYLGKPIVQEALEGRWSKAGVRVAAGALLAYSAYRIVKDMLYSGAMHAPLAREINEAAVYSIKAHAPREDAA